jgi:hypothetical protein
MNKPLIAGLECLQKVIARGQGCMAIQRVSRALTIDHGPPIPAPERL